jgi:hypothetical protein
VTFLAQRLHAALTTAGVAVEGVVIGVEADRTTWLVRPSNLQAAAQPTINAFDVTEAAETTWIESQEPDLKALKDQAAAATATNTTYLAIGSPTNAQNLAQIRALTQQNQRIISALLRTIQRTWR